MPIKNNLYVRFYRRLKVFLVKVIYHRIHRLMQAVSTLYVFRHANQKSVRAQIHMMPIGTPRVAYRTPGEGTYQWIDLWNALVSCYILIYKRY
jgi:hypothetical protein